MENYLDKVLNRLRVAGVVMIFASATTFVVQNWQGANDIQRYLSLLAFSAAIPVVSYVSGILMKESKSARLLMAALLSLVPLHCGILAGFVLSHFSSTTNALRSIPIWSAGSRGALWLVCSSALLVLVPLTVAGFRILDRQRVRFLSLAYCTANLLLLVPTREQSAMIWIALFMAISAVIPSIKASYFSTEARGASILLWLPLICLSARQFLYYEASYLFIGVSSAIIAGISFALGRDLKDNRFIEQASTLPALISVASFLAHESSRPDYANYLLFALVSAAVVFAMAGLSRYSRHYLAHLALSVLVVFTTLGLLSKAHPWPAMQALTLGIAMIACGTLRSNRSYTVPGLILALTGFLMQMEYAMRVYRWNGWFILACFGLLLLIAVAYIDRRLAKVRATKKLRNAEELSASQEV